MKMVNFWYFVQIPRRHKISIRKYLMRPGPGSIFSVIWILFSVCLKLKIVFIEHFLSKYFLGILHKISRIELNVNLLIHFIWVLLLGVGLSKKFEGEKFWILLFWEKIWYIKIRDLVFNVSNLGGNSYVRQKNCNFFPFFFKFLLQIEYFF